MPLPKGLARFNLKVTNRITSPFAHRLPGFAVVHHVGRKSGRPRTTPVNMFRNGDEYVVPLTYGRDSQWVKNVLAAGELDLVTRGKRIRLAAPRIVQDGKVPAPVHAILKTLNVVDYVVARPDSSK
jgi:deazaflavin-dependent oxidoreductase (nitroreductase family)